MHKAIGRSFCVLLAVGALGACSKKEKSKVEGAFNRARHSAASCPKLASGHYRMQEGSTAVRPKFIDVARDNKNNLIVTFDNEDKLVANGKEQKLSDGAVFTVSCTGDSVLVAGTDERNERTSLKMFGGDKGLTVKMSEPSEMTVLYQKSDILEEGIDKGAKAIEETGKAAKELVAPQPGTQPRGQSGMPTPDDKGRQPVFPTQPVPQQPMPQQQ